MARQTLKKKWRIKHPGVCADSRALGVGWRHLIYVLNGERTSHSLLSRYRELQRTKRKSAIASVRASLPAALAEINAAAGHLAKQGVKGV